MIGSSEILFTFRSTLFLTILKTSSNVLDFQIRVVVQNLLVFGTGREHVYNIPDADAHSVNAGLARHTALDFW